MLTLLFSLRSLVLIDQFLFCLRNRIRGNVCCLTPCCCRAGDQGTAGGGEVEGLLQNWLSVDWFSGTDRQPFPDAKVFIPKGMNKALLFLTHTFKSISCSTDNFTKISTYREEGRWRRSRERFEDVGLYDWNDATTSQAMQAATRSWRRLGMILTWSFWRGHRPAAPRFWLRDTDFRCLVS